MVRYSADFKEKVVMRYAEGESVKDLSELTGAGESSIYEWINKSKSVPISSFQKTIRDQANKIARLESMIEIIHKCDFFNSIPLETKLNAIDGLYADYGINIACDALNVAHGTFHNHQKRGKGYGKQWLHEKRKRELLPEIIKIDNEFNHIYGADKITAELNRRGYETCKKTVLKIMREEGIVSIRNYANDYRKEHQKNGKINIVNRQFNPDKPNQIWVSDVTYLRIDDKHKNTFYLCVIMDLYSRKVIAHAVGNSNSKQLVNATLKKAVDTRGVDDGLIFHSDRGSNYVSTSFSDNLKKFGIQQSFSKAGTPYDNSPMESFFQNFKKECFYRYHIKSRRALVELVDEYVAFYNEKRSHRHLGYKSPNEYENIKRK